MADVKMNDFLLQYFKQLRFNEMPVEVFATFQGYIKSGDDFNGNMKDWKENLVYQYNNNWYKNCVPNLSRDNPRRARPNATPPEYPNANKWVLSDDECDKLFNAFQDAFRGMNQDRDSLAGASVDFLDKNFGDSLAGKLFSYGVASRDTENEITQLKDLLNDADIARGVAVEARDALAEAKVDFAAFKSGLDSGRYNTDIKFRKAVQAVAGHTQRVIYYSDTLRVKYPDIPSFDNIRGKFEDNKVPAAKRDEFRDKYDELLNTLYKNDKIRADFGRYDGGKIAPQVDAARGKVDFENTSSKDYVPPKRDDQLTPLQQMSRYVGDTFEDYMSKYTKFRGDRLYFSDQAKSIAKALSGKKIALKPTDGLGKLLDKAGDVKKALQQKTHSGADHFSWMVDTLTEMKNTMPEAFNGALSHGRQMRHLVSAIITKAVQASSRGDAKAIEKAKTTMEILSVFKYGYTTSKIMDAFGKQEFSVFSDGKLSWNKHQATKMVTTAMDKSIKWSFMALGYGITMVGNAINLSGSKFKGDGGNTLNRGHSQWVADNERDLKAAKKARTRDNRRDRALRDAAKTEIENVGNVATTGAGYDVTKGNLKTRKTDLDAKKQTLDRANETLERAGAAREKARGDVNKALHGLDVVKKVIKDYEDLQQSLVDMQAQIDALDTQIQADRDFLNDTNNFAGLSDEAKQSLIQETTDRIRDSQRTQDQLRQQMQQNQDAVNDNRRLAQYQAAVNILPAREAALNNAKTALSTANTNLTNAENAYNAASADYAQLNTNITKYEDATRRVKELSKNISDRNKVIREWDSKHKDMYKELMAYWDFLETGRNRHGGNMYSWSMGSAKVKQRAFDNNKVAMFNQFRDNYTMVA